MKPRIGRTGLALALTLAAVAAPCTCWYFAGLRAVRQQAAALLAEPEQAARASARELAGRLGERLGALLKAEEKRPYYQYQNLIHDPNGASEGVAVHPSPLAEGPSDPCVWTYFQISPTDRLSLPTLNDEVEQTGKTQEELEAQQAVRKALEAAVPVCVEAFRAAQPGRPEPTGLQAADGARASANQQMRAVKMKPEAYAQNQFANTVFLNNEGNLAAAGKKQNAWQLPVSKSSVTIQIGPFQWMTLPAGGKPALAAVREVITPEGRLFQGFVVAAAGAEESFRGAAFPTSLLPAPQQAGQAGFAAPIAETGWQLVADAGAAMARARTQAGELRQSFWGFFSLGVAAAVAAGCCVVGLVWQAEQLARQRSQFAASAAHELRTPLAGLRLYGEMLAEGLGDAAKTRDYARRIAAEAERLSRVISNVLGFTRLERGRLTVHPKPGDLCEAVRNLLSPSQAALELAGLGVELNLPQGLPPVPFDADALAVIFQNLLDNAEKHTRAGANRRVEITVKPAGRAVALAVADHGPGVPGALRGRLFRPFARGDEPDAPPGLGLGLAMARALVQAHGGTLEHTGTPGGGATFTAFFPV